MKKHKMLFLIALSATTPVFSTVAVETSQADEMRSAYSEWVQLRKTIAEEKSAWDEDKAILNDQIGVLEAEKLSLQTLINEAEAVTDQSKNERAVLLDEKQQAIDAVSILNQKIPGYETSILELVGYFPEPLIKEIKPLLNRVPKPGETTRQSASQRLQNVVGILTQMDKFNQGVTLVSEVKDIGGGNMVEVKTLYLGLGIAYFVDRNGEYSGYGEPTSGGWKWTVDKDLSTEIQALVTTYQNVSKASFVTIPVKIN